jgi:hypothetical protein
MPLSAPSKRKPLHTREVTCQGFLREDGLIDIEGHLNDTKPFDFPNQDRGGLIKAGESLHGMSIRITLDHTMKIHKAEAIMDFTPYDYCKSIASVFEKLAGIRIGSGWRSKVKEIMGGQKGCTHLTELLGPMATTAFQTLVSLKKDETEKTGQEEPHEDYVPYLINSCFTHAEDSPVVQKNWPEYYRKGKQAV